MDPKTLFERWKRSPPLSGELTSALDDLARLATDRPQWARPALGLASLLKAAFHPPESGSIDQDSLTRMTQGWSNGRPAFQEYLPSLNESTLIARSRRLVEALESENPSARGFQSAVRSRAIDLVAWTNDALSGRHEAIHQSAEVAGLDPALASSILRLTLLPSLALISTRLDPIRPEGAWDRGDCPNCGSRPILAESRGLEQRIYYRCGLCASGWPGERLRCPSCGEDRSKALDYSFVDGEQDRFRVAHCQTCRYDWKVVSTLSELSPAALLVADLASVHLDLLADDLKPSI